MVRCPYRVRKGKNILCKITGNTQLRGAGEEKKKKSPLKSFIVYYMEIHVIKAQSVGDNTTQTWKVIGFAHINQVCLDA